MKLHLNEVNLPKEMSSIKWDILQSLVDLNDIGIKMSTSYFNAVPHWTISEKLEEFEFLFHRNKATKQRITELDPFGVVGFSTINPEDNRVYLTEGVSDFITVKLTHPQMNVLGMTTLSGSTLSKKLVCSLFDKICIVADNDSTGISNAHKMRKFYESYGKACKVIMSESGFKDITEQFMFELLKELNRHNCKHFW